MEEDVVDRVWIESERVRVREDGGKAGESRRWHRRGSSPWTLHIHPSSLLPRLQIVMLAFLVASVPACKMNRCYDDGELREAAERKLRSHYPQPPDPLPTADPDSPPSCPVDQFRSLARDNTNERSLSPWRYV